MNDLISKSCIEVSVNTARLNTTKTLKTISYYIAVERIHITWNYLNFYRIKYCYLNIRCINVFFFLATSKFHAIKINYRKKGSDLK